MNKGDWDKSQGFDEDNSFNRKWISACREHLKPDGTIWISGTYHNIFSAAKKLKIHKSDLITKAESKNSPIKR